MSDPNSEYQPSTHDIDRASTTPNLLNPSSYDPSSYASASYDGASGAVTELAATAPHFLCPMAVPSQIASWMVIVFCTGLMMVLVYLNSAMEEADPNQKPSTVDADISSQLAVGFEQWFGTSSPELLEGLESGPVHRRVARIVVLAEMASREKDTDQRAKRAESAREEFAELRQKIAEADYSPTEREQEVLDSAQRVVFAKLDGSPLPESSADVERLRKDLGFAGKLAESWGSADKKATSQLRTTAAVKMGFMFGFVALVLGSGFLGLCVVAVVLYLLFMGKFASRMQPGSGWGTLHLEAFAVWMASFIAAQFLLGMVVSTFRLEVSETAGLGFVLSMLASYGPVLIGLAWLLVRHPQRRLALQEVGFTSRGFFGDVTKAITTHLSFLPVLGLAILLTIILSLIFLPDTGSHSFAPPKGPSHPIQEKFDGSIVNSLLLFFLAAITAPLVEETVFRGFLYRYLRDLTARETVWRPLFSSLGLSVHRSSPLVERSCLWLSVGTATLANGLIFAAIHPQGLLGIPPLMALAAAMSIAREWSGGLMAPMIIHAVNNGALVIFMSIMFS